jgi:hypothetical protein
VGREVTQKESIPTWDPHRLNSDKPMERQDQLYISIQEENTSMKDVKHDRSD